ncbi:MAG: ParB N-terminal domain-containing protein [Stellaceae bacterium]
MAPFAVEHAVVAINTLVPNPRNPREHPVAQLERLAASIRRFGQPRDVLVRKENRMIVAGHGVTEACKLAGVQQVNVILWDVDQATADAFMVGDNRLGQLGVDDADQLKALLRELGFADPESMGYDAPEIDALLAEAVAEADVKEIPVTPVVDRFWISIRGTLNQQAKALRRLRELMADLPGVDVTLGTIADGN